MLASAISVVAAIPPAAITDGCIWSPGRTAGLGIAVPIVVARCDNYGGGRSRITIANALIRTPGRTPGLGVAARCDNYGGGRSRITIANALIWSPGRTPGLGVAVPVLGARCDNYGGGRSRIAITDAWIWSPGRTPGLGVAVPVVVARRDHSGRRRRRNDWPTGGNKSSAGKAGAVVPDHAAPRRAATQHADIGACRHRADNVEAKARSTAQVEIVGECCCRNRACGQQQDADGK